MKVHNGVPVQLAAASRFAADEDQKFFVYDPAEYEPRFEGEFASCQRKGADMMFLQSLLHHRRRTLNHTEASLVVVPCLFESHRHCHVADKRDAPVGSKAAVGSKATTSLLQPSRTFSEFSEDNENEVIPWTVSLDNGTSECLAKVMNSTVYQANWGADHLFLAADYAMNFLSATDADKFVNMTVGQIEVTDEIERAIADRKSSALPRCSVVVPYASDVDLIQEPPDRSFEQWNLRPNVLNYRFEQRRYGLWCKLASGKGHPCRGSKDRTDLRQSSLKVGADWEQFGLPGSPNIVSERVPLENYSSELHQSKFCLVVAGDTASSHSYFDAVAAGCIPILISDRWDALAVPMAHGSAGIVQGGINFSTFTLRLAENLFMEDPHALLERLSSLLSDETELRSLVNALYDNQKFLLWAMPGNTVSSRVLSSAMRCVKLD